MRSAHSWYVTSRFSPRTDKGVRSVIGIPHAALGRWDARNEPSLTCRLNTVQLPQTLLPKPMEPRERRLEQTGDLYRRTITGCSGETLVPSSVRRAHLVHPGATAI